MLSATQDKEVRTIEGLAEIGTNGETILHPVQQAFLDELAPQCSWCMSGQRMTAAALLEQNPEPNADEIRQAIEAVYCRFGTYHRIRKAVLAGRLKGRRALGKLLPRVDLPAKIIGQAVFGFDVRMPDMLYGTVAQPETELLHNSDVVGEFMITPPIMQNEILG